MQITLNNVCGYFWWPDETDHDLNHVCVRPEDHDDQTPHRCFCNDTWYGA